MKCNVIEEYRSSETLASAGCIEATCYARKRITDHLARFNFLHNSIRKNNIKERYLLTLETRDNIFPDIDFRDFNPRAATLMWKDGIRRA